MGNIINFKNMETTGSIFITTPTDPVGYRCALRLLRAGYPQVRVGLRHPDLGEELNKEGAEIADFSWDHEETFDHAVKGVRAVFCVIPYKSDWEQHFPVFLEACKKAGVQYFVKVSFYHARNAEPQLQSIPLVKLHGMCDKMLAQSGLNFTILSASHFMHNPLLLQKQLRGETKPVAYYGASHGHGVNYVSPNDVAEVGSRVLLEPKTHFGKEYTLTGPEAITDQTVAQLMSKHLEKPIIYADQPFHTFEEMEMKGDPSWMVKDLLELEKLKASGFEESKEFVTNDVSKICGHPAESFQDYLSNSHSMMRAEMA